MTRTLSLNYKRAAIATTVVSLLCVGCFFSVSTARAATSNSVEESLPMVLSSTQLVLGAVSERIGTNGMALASASTVSDPQIAVLMKLLEQLIAMYQSILASQQGGGNDDDAGPVPGVDTFIEVLSPNGGELYTDGDKMMISWSVANSLMPVDIHLIARYSGNSFIVKQNYTPTLGTGKKYITWLVDGSHDAQKDTLFKIKICQAGTYTSRTCDTSDKYFTILPKDDGEPSQAFLITSASLHKGSSDAYIRVRSRSIENAVELRYSANCCKPTEGTLEAGKMASDRDAIFFLDTYLGNVKVEDLKIKLVGADGQESNWYQVAVDDESAGEEPSVSSSFSYEQDYTLGGSHASPLTADLTYTIENYRDGLVLDVEPQVNCDNSMLAPTYTRDCSHYVFDLSGKAAEKYVGVKADPYVKGGVGYRFTGANGQLYIAGYQQTQYIVIPPYIVPEPDSVEFRFILRDLNDGGRTLWSETKVAQFKG